MAPIEYFLIAGATGRQGGAVVDALLHDSTAQISPSNIFAITRNGSGSSAQRLISKYPGINIIVGDLNNAPALFAQIDRSILPRMGVYLAQAHGPTEVSDARGYIDEAAAKQIPYFVYSSVDRGGKEKSDREASSCKTFSDKFIIENHLKSTASNSIMDYTILRPTWFIDNAEWGFPGKLCMTGWRDNMKGQRMQVTCIRDIGRWAIEALVRPDKFGIRNSALSIASDELSFEDVDNIYQREAGRRVGVANGWLTASMIWLVKDLNTMFGWIRGNPYGADLEWLKQRLEPTTFEEWVKATVAKQS